MRVDPMPAKGVVVIISENALGLLYEAAFEDVRAQFTMNMVAREKAMNDLRIQYAQDQHIRSIAESLHRVAYAVEVSAGVEAEQKNKRARQEST